MAPEWFYKGDGSSVVAPGQPLAMPAFALDGGEEAEIAVLYLNDDHGRPRRIGYALGNEFSDHVLERQNYLYLAHSKLRPCAIGPELLLGELPHDLRGTVSVLRGEERRFEAEWQSGEANMSHTLANLEHHHFKYRLFRRPGDVHVHFLGAAVLSFGAGIKVEPGDVFEIAAEPFGAPLRNPLARRSRTRAWSGSSPSSRSRSAGPKTAGASRVRSHAEAGRMSVTRRPSDGRLGRDAYRNAGSSKLLSLREWSASGPISSRRIRIASRPISRCWLMRSR